MRSGSRALLIANALGAALSVGSAIAGLVKPEIVLPGETVTPLADLYVQAYTARAVALGAGVLWMLAGRHRALAPALAVAGAIQAGDAAIGVAHHIPGMAAGAGLLAVLHLGSAWWLARAGRPAVAVAA